MNDTQRSVIMQTKSTKKGTTTVIASTPNPDRYSDVVAGGEEWLIDAYMQNPVVQFGHRYDIPPVGRTEKLTVDEATGNLVATIRWDDVPTNPLAQTVSAQFRSGMMSAVSVGFQPTDSIPRSKLASDHPAHGEKGMYFTGNRLLEISAVPVPANGEALALRSLGLTQAKSILNVEETEDAYIVTYAKYPQNDESEPDEEEAINEEEDEDSGDDTDGKDDVGHGEGNSKEEVRPGPHAYDEDDDEDSEKAFTTRVRGAVLELLGHDPTIQAALTPATKRKTTQYLRDGLSDMLGIDN